MSNSRNYNTPSIYTFKCINQNCVEFDKEVKVHSDDLVGQRKIFMQYFDDTKRWVEMNKWTCINSICSCNCKMETTNEEEAEIKNPDLHKTITHIPHEARYGKKFWTNYKTKQGGIPEFNPVTNAGGSGQQNPHNL